MSDVSEKVRYALIEQGKYEKFFTAATEGIVRLMATAEWDGEVQNDFCVDMLEVASDAIRQGVTAAEAQALSELDEDQFDWQAWDLIPEYCAQCGDFLGGYKMGHVVPEVCWSCREEASEEEADVASTTPDTLVVNGVTYVKKED